MADKERDVRRIRSGSIANGFLFSGDYVKRPKRKARSKPKAGSPSGKCKRCGKIVRSTVTADGYVVDCAKKDCIFNTPAINGPFATSGELAKEFGASQEEAKRFETRMEFLSGNKPRSVR